MMDQESPTKIKNFKDLNAWQEGHRLVLDVYKITAQFPKEEQFGLISQLRRAAVSFTSNIAEGFSRYSYKDKANFYSIALGSLTEAENQILVARDMNYMSATEFNNLSNQIIVINKLTNGLIKKSRLVHEERSMN